MRNGPQRSPPAASRIGELIYSVRHLYVDDWEHVVETYGIRELQRRSSEIVDELERSRRPALVTRHGKPVAVLSPIDDDALEDHILANAPEFVASMTEADEDGRAGRTRPLADVVAELEAADPE